MPRSHRAHLVSASLVFLAGGIALPAQADRDAEAFQIGIGLLQRQLHDEAGKQFEKFLRDKPEHALAAEAHYRLACCRLELNDAERAIASLRVAIDRGGERFKLRPEALYRLGSALHQTGKHIPAHETLSKLLTAIDDKHYLRPPALFAAGESLRDAKRDADAAATFLAAAAADPDPAGAYAVPARYQAGFALLRLNQFAEAETAFAAAAEGHPQHPACGECWYLAGDAAYRAGRYEPALAAFAASEKLPSEFVDDAVLGTAWAKLQLGDRAAARAQFQRVVDAFAASPLAPKARLEWGRLLQQDGEHEKAAQTLIPLLAEGTAVELRTEAHEITGLAEAARGQQEKALTHLRGALATAPATARARLLVAIGGAHAARAEWPLALQAYEQAKAAQPDAALAGEALYGASLALHKVGRFDDSTRAATQLMRDLPEHRLRQHAALAVAENLFASKKYKEAEAAYEPLERGESTFARDARFKRAWSVYMQGGRQVEAADVFAALCQGKDESHAEEALSMLALAALEAGAQDRALEAADRYRARYPKGEFLARTERVASRSLQSKGDLTGAAQRLTAAAKVEGQAERGRQDRLEVAELLFKKSDFAAATAAYDELAAADDAVAARALEGSAWCAFELGDDNKALELVDRALAHQALGARLPDALQLRCATLQRAQRWDDAAAVAQRFLVEAGKDARAPEMQYALGLSLARTGKADAARKVLEPLASAGGGPHPDRTAYELAWSCRKAGDEKAALVAFGKVVELTKDEELAGEARLHLGEALLADSKLDAARATLEQVRGTHRARALYRVGFADLEKEPARAQATFATMLREGLQGNFSDDARFLLGESSQRAGDQAAATVAFAQALQQLPEHARAQAGRVRGGEAAVRAGRPGDAVAWLEDFVRRDKDTSESGKVERARAHLWLGQARAERKEWPQAVAALQQVTELTDTELAAEAQFRLGLARKSQGELEGAVDAFVKLSILYGHAEWVQRGLFEAGVCYRELNQPQKAAKFFAELKQRFPDSTWNARATNSSPVEKRSR